MHILLLSATNDLLALLGAVANLELSGLVVCAVGARNQLLIFLLEGEPSLQIVLLSSSIVESAGDDTHNLVGKAKGLVELLRVGHHLVELVPAVIGATKDELLDLLELMHTEYTPGITAVAASLLSEASTVTTVLDGELSGLDPLIGVEGGEGLLAGRDQVSIRLGGSSQAVTSVANKLDTSNRVISSKSQEHVVVREGSLLGLVESFGGPGSLDGVVILVIANVYGLVNVVSDKLGLDPELGVLGRSKLLLCLLLLCQLVLLLEKLGRILLRSLLETNLLLDAVYLCSDLSNSILSLSKVSKRQIVKIFPSCPVTHSCAHLAKGQ
ncbi:hypothetical protein HG530_000778 [Fusarium avenaceum]|nr:hypothetical protein HG530_000778 [Fusarium avenaceum]